MNNGDWYKRWKLLFKTFFMRSKEGELPPVSDEEVNTLITVGTESGIINEGEGEMIQGIFRLKEMLVREVMVPRTDIIAVRSDATVNDLIKLVKEEGHTRYPVYKETLDNIVGLIHVKDVLRNWSGDRGEKIGRLIRQPFIVPETKRVEELLEEFKRRRMHIAIIVDEYGGTSGVITIEDIIEEIVGDIRDEHDMEEVRIVDLLDGSMLVDARLDIEELEEHLGRKIEKEDFESVGGLVTLLAGRVPRMGEEVVFEDLIFIVESADEKKVKKLRVIKKAVEGVSDAE